MSNAVVTLKKGEGRALKQGGAWIFDNEIASILGAYENGDIVLVRDFDGYPMGRGFINEHSKIRIRMMTRNIDQEIDEAFLRKRVQDAWEYRKKVTDTSSCRLIFGEADFLPGLVVDKFSDVLVVQSLALGIDKMKMTIIRLLEEVLAADGVKIRGVFERSDAKVREQEGMERVKGFLSEPFDTSVEIVENGVHYLVDVKDGQKTGSSWIRNTTVWTVQKLCKGRESARLLYPYRIVCTECGICRSKRKVIGVDASELGVEQARKNASLNGLENVASFVCEDVFELLPRLEKEGEKFDVVILDPPAFTKSRNSIKNAIKGYREINLRGMKLVKDGGYLCTCSCSHFMDYELFTKTINQAAHNVHKRLRQVEYRTQAPDHPILWAADESYYLKFYIFQVVDEK